MKCAQNLSHEVCGVTIKLWNKDARALSVHVRHASVEVQVHCVNVVIGVVLGEMHVVRVVPVVVCDDAVVRRTLVLIDFHRSHCFHRSHFAYDFAVLEVLCLHVLPRSGAQCMVCKLRSFCLAAQVLLLEFLFEVAPVVGHSARRAVVETVICVLSSCVFPGQFAVGGCC